MSFLLLLEGPGPDAALIVVPTLIGSYTNTYDFGILVLNAIITIVYNVEAVVGTGSLVVSLTPSIDGINFTTPIVQNPLFQPAVRAVRVTFTFTGSNDKSAIKISGLRVTLSVHTETDSGTKLALLFDVGGTRVTFNKTFQAIDSLTVTPLSSTTAFAAYTNLDKTGFNVLVWDSTGARVSKTVSWIVRGVT